MSIISSASVNMFVSWKITTFTLLIPYCRKMTSSDLGNGLGNKSSMLRSDKQMFVAPSMLARGHERMLQELYASKSHNTSFFGEGD